MEKYEEAVNCENSWAKDISQVGGNRLSETSSAHLETIAYLEGLVVGRGRLFRKQRRILIEFPHKNPTLGGIAHCPKCGWLATGQRGLKCKNPKCKRLVPSTVRTVYDQQADTRKSINEDIAPWLSDHLDCTVRVGSGSTSTHMIVDFQPKSDVWSKINRDLKTGQSFHEFHLPADLNVRTRGEKREFVNGLLDTAGFVNAGSWLPRDGENGHGRMRLYFQVVKNWSLVVEIDNFLRREFDVPIQTIDWGHPNIRSANVNEGATSSATREHQIKIFPEFMSEFKFRILCKQRLMNELIKHNKSVGFDQVESWFPPRKISETTVKANHPAENDPRLPLEVRRHFDAFWQINLALGCRDLTDLASKSLNPEVFALTGDSDSDEPLPKIRARLRTLSRLATPEFEERDPDNEESTRARATPEFETYEPLRAWLQNYLRARFDSKALAWVTSDRNLAHFLRDVDHEAIEMIENLDDLRIRPDVVGLLPESGELAFVESKVTPLNIREVGQLMGYCLVAQPRLGFLISTKPIDTHLASLIHAHPELTEFQGGRQIELCHFDTKTMKKPKGLSGALIQ